MKNKKAKVFLPPGWMETSLRLPLTVNPGTYTRAQYTFKHNNAAGKKTTHKVLLSYNKYLSLVAENLPASIKTKYTRSKDLSTLVLEFENSGKKGLKAHDVSLLIGTSPRTPLGKITIKEQCLCRILKFGWDKCFYRFPTAEEIKQPGTVPIGSGEIESKSKGSYEKIYTINIVRRMF